MKGSWRWMVVLALLVMLISVPLIAHFSHGSSSGPRYVPLQSQPTGPFGHIYYDWDGDVPFLDGKAWVFSVLSRTNGHEYLYDVERGKALGELLHGGAVLSTADHSKVLCEDAENFNASFRSSAISLINKIFGGRLPKANRLDTYWMLDVKRNSAHSVGALSQLPGTGSRWHQSPDFRLGYNVPNNYNDEDHAFYLCDLQEETFRKIKVEGKLQGWWNERQVMIKTASGDFDLYDVFDGTTSPFLDLKTIGKALAAGGITSNPSNVDTINHWNGSNYDFMLVPGNSWARYTNTSFVFDIGRPHPSLTLVQTNFQFRWLGNFNADGSRYVYPGESKGFGKGGNGGVFLQDFHNGKVVTLVPPDNKGQYSIPRLYKDTVVYFRNQEIRRVNIDGSDDSAFFPPSNK